MIPENPLPYGGAFSSPEDYVVKLLEYVQTTDIFRILCGGVHIVDFFTTEPGLFHAALPQEWHAFLLSCDIMRLLDLLMRDDLNSLDFEHGQGPPESLVQYIRSIRDLSLRREFHAPKQKQKLPVLPRSVAVGMKPKKVHEVTNFADYIERLSGDIAESCGDNMSHFVDFGSGQNYLGRALASEPYNRRVVAVEGRENNVAAARELDRLSGLAVKQKVMRNKKLWNKILEVRGRDKEADGEALADAIRQVAGAEAFDFRPMNELESRFTVEEGKGHVQYVSGRLDSGDLAEVIANIDHGHVEGEQRRKLELMAVSIHSCGNLSHYGIRSLILNPEIRAIAIVGCCYNLMTEKLGPPTYKHPYLRPALRALNGRVARESEKHDPQGFPISNRFSTYQGEGIRLNITARMMACQAPQNWSREDSDGFFTRHFFRAVLQRIFLDRGVVGRIWHRQPPDGSEADSPGSAFDVSTSPVTIGGLRKHCYASLRTYVRGAIHKLTTSGEYRQYASVMRDKMGGITDDEYRQYASVMRDKMGGITDDEIDGYEAEYLPRRRELCAVWSLMAFSAMVAESLIVTDRWMFLKEHRDVVRHAWVEAVFDYKQSPRNLVVVGVKKHGA